EPENRGKEEFEGSEHRNLPRSIFDIRYSTFDISVGTAVIVINVEYRISNIEYRSQYIHVTSPDWLRLKQPEPPDRRHWRPLQRCRRCPLREAEQKPSPWPPASPAWRRQIPDRARCRSCPQTPARWRRIAPSLP